MRDRLLISGVVALACLVAPKPDLHAAVLAASSLLVSPGSEQGRLGIRIAGTPAVNNLIQASDLSCHGAFLTPQLQTQAATSNYPITYRYESGTRNYYVYDGQGHLQSFPEPTLSPCNTAIASMSTGSFPGWGGDWGQVNVAAHGGWVPGTNSTLGQGLYWDATLSKMVFSWYPYYATVVQSNSFAQLTLNDVSHTMTTFSCNGIPAYNTLATGGSVFRAPSAFVTANLPAGAAWVVGNGGSVGYAPGMNYGNAAVAVVPPSTNACTTDTDYNILSSTEMELHTSNLNGPNCAYPAEIGCTPATAPTAPYPAPMAFKDYSVSVFQPNWDPYGGHGWWTWDSEGKTDWYDDGVKQGIVTFMVTPSGWVNTPVLASPTPTFSSGTGGMSIASTSTHDGYHINPNDVIWVESCVVGVDPGCELANANNLTTGIVSTVNNSTGAITYAALFTDSGSGTHAPVVGGKVYAGSLYAHGAPTSSRLTFRLQVYDPATYVNVIGGGQTSNSVQYASEADFISLVSQQFGGPQNTTTGGLPTAVGGHNLSGVMADPTAHQIMVSLSAAKTGIGVTQDIVYVLDVAQSAPLPASWPMALTALGLAGVLMLASRPTR